MNNLHSIIMIIVAVIFLILLIKILSAPIKLIFKLILNAGLGWFNLLIVNLIGGFFNFQIDTTLINMLIAGVFGFPGAAVLVALKLFF